MVGRTVYLRVPILIPESWSGNRVIVSCEAIVPVDVISHEVNAPIKIENHADNRVYSPSAEDHWAIDEILGKYWSSNRSDRTIDDAITEIVDETILTLGDSIFEWLQVLIGGPNEITLNGKKVPDWLALYVLNAHVYGDPGMWNPYGIDKIVDTISFSAVDFIETYKDPGLSYLEFMGRLKDYLLPGEDTKLNGHLDQNQRDKWSEGSDIPSSVKGLEELARIGIHLPIKGSDSMFQSMLGLATNVYYHGSISSGDRPRINIPLWVDISYNQMDLKDVDYRLWPFSATHLQDRSFGINNPYRAIARSISTIGVPRGDKRGSEHNRYLIDPVAESLKMLKSGVDNNLILSFVEDYLESFILLKSHFVRARANEKAHLNLSFFTKKFPLPPEYIPGDKLYDLREIEATNPGLQEHIELMKFLFPNIRFSVRERRKAYPNAQVPYFTVAYQIIISDYERLMDEYPKLQVHYDRPTRHNTRR